ncbi:MAG: alpha-D-glucose phosphate-specific phosphoglucomutase [Verrucomicrobia bacterium]|nr:alpha-D-glucose phosphate-specific phosphoglucomutase [Verrucomicrobiota bacterium]
MKIDPLAGSHPRSSMLTNIPKLITAYYTNIPDPVKPTEQVSFGTSGHRGSSLTCSFNENHILATSQAICQWREQNGITGPLYIGIDTHALSEPAFATALEVLVANGVEVMISEGNLYTPTPVISHAILTYNKGRKDGLADGIVITPSHNPPDEGGFKYNPPNGGPADTNCTNWIQKLANEFLKNGLKGVKRVPFERAYKAARPHNFTDAYIRDLENVIDMKLIKEAQISLGVDPLGGAGVYYWQAIKERYGLDLTIVNSDVDPTFRFMTLDWDGKIRMDPSSPYAMQRLITLKEQFQIAFACDTDHDRHGIVTKSSGLMPPNQFLSAAIYYLFQNRPQWDAAKAVGKTMVSSRMIDRVAKRLGRKLYEVPVGFKWFVDGLFEEWLGFGGEESAGASFSRFDGSVWTTDKDGIIPSLLAAEMTARMKKDPGELYCELTKEFGESVYDRLEAKATPQQKEALKNASSDMVKRDELAGEKIMAIHTHAPGNGASLGGIKVEAKSGWFAARPSGTEEIYKIYVESFKGEEHFTRIAEEAQDIVDAIFKK